MINGVAEPAPSEVTDIPHIAVTEAAVFATGGSASSVRYLSSAQTLTLHLAYHQVFPHRIARSLVALVTSSFNNKNTNIHQNGMPHARVL